MPKGGDQPPLVFQTAARSSSALCRDVRAELLQKHRDQKNQESEQSAQPPRALWATFAFARRSSSANGVRPSEENNMLPSLRPEPSDQSICLRTVCPASSECPDHAVLDCGRRRSVAGSGRKIQSP